MDRAQKSNVLGFLILVHRHEYIHEIFPSDGQKLHAVLTRDRGASLSAVHKRQFLQDVDGTINGKTSHKKSSS